MTVRIIMGSAGSGKSKVMFKEIREKLDGGEDKVLMLSAEIPVEHIVTEVGNTDNLLVVYSSVYPKVMSTLAPWLLLQEPTYKAVYIDGFQPTIKDIELIEHLANYSGIKEVVITMQTNRHAAGSGVMHCVYADGQICFDGESVADVQK